MTALFADKTIQKRVMTVVKARVQKAQDIYEAGCDAHDQHCEEVQKQAEIDRDAAKATLADGLVQDIVGKFL